MHWHARSLEDLKLVGHADVFASGQNVPVVHLSVVGVFEKHFRHVFFPFLIGCFAIEYGVGFIDDLLKRQAIGREVWTARVIGAGYLPVQPDVALQSVVPQFFPPIPPRDVSAESGACVDARLRADRAMGHAAFVLDGDGRIVRHIVRIGIAAVRLRDVLVDLACCADAIMSRGLARLVGERGIGAGEVSNHDVQGDVRDSVAVPSLVVIRAAFPDHTVHYSSSPVLLLLNSVSSRLLFNSGLISPRFSSTDETSVIVM